MTKMMQMVYAVLLLAAIAPLRLAVAADEPLPPEDAYRYVVSDVGDAVEIDWAIEDGYYLYKSKLGFVSNTPSVVLGDPELPQGLEHEDEFFGKQEIYRNRFYVRVPYTIQGETPESFELVIKSQGCADMGLCYPPQSWIENVELHQPAASNQKLDLGKLGGLGGSEFLPVDEAFRPVVIPINGNTVEVSWQIAPGYYLYKDKIGVRSLTDNVQLGRLDLPQGKLKFDEFFGESEVYLEDVFARLPLARATPDAMELALELNYQGCAEDGLCYPPTTRTLTVALPLATAVGELPVRPADATPVSEQSRLATLITEANIWWVVASFFGIGLLLAFTPCVLPMIPILTAIIAGEGKHTSPMRGFTLAFSYVMGMALVYTAAGIGAAAAGAQLQATFNQPWVLILFAGLFVLLAVAMFGGYDLQMPSGLQTRLATISGSQKSGTTIGAAIMGALSALIVTACVAPALIASLTVMAQSGDMLRGGTSLFAMSMGMGAPLLLVGAAQGHLLPRAGAWMVAIKASFGFMLLGLAIWMLSRILPGTVTLALWGVLVFMTGVFLGGLTTLGSDAAISQKLGKGFGFLGIIYGLLLLFGALTGGDSVIRPLAQASFGSKNAVTAETHGLEFKRIKTVADLDRELAAAAAAGKTAMLDFYADWCVSCKEMEAFTFTDARVRAVLADSVLLQADVTKNDALDQELLQRFGVFGPPTIIFFGTDGQQRHGYEVVGYMKAKDFATHVQQALGAATTVIAEQQ
ncbi:MAG: protein-disulfide reductase DsbD [Gammaproteobacteria bacterium]|nr:protein-disulfide reductase DsbD [Gammaproteobacteria bacterium]